MSSPGEQDQKDALASAVLPVFTDCRQQHRQGMQLAAIREVCLPAGDCLDRYCEKSYDLSTIVVKRHTTSHGIKMVS